MNEFELLWRFSRIDSPSGDEGEFCDFLETLLPGLVSGLRLIRLGDSLIVVRGRPAVALIAHIDTTGFTLGYDSLLIPLGSPGAKPGDPLREAGRVPGGHSAGKSVGRRIKLRGPKGSMPGSRWVYDRSIVFDNGYISGPYLDNRAGVWAATQALMRCPDVAVAYTTGEESSGHGAMVCAKHLYEELKITSSLISDITWHTKHVRCGDGPAISLRDTYAPRQRFLDRVVAAAAKSGLPFQLEIESDGGSDGAHIQRTPYPLDWVFIGAPEEDAHGSNERISASDLIGMADLLSYMVAALGAESAGAV